MDTPLEDYALLSDMHTAALVSREGSIDWLCLPRFDSPSVFTALLGTDQDGRWKLSVEDGEVVDWRYEPDTFVLTTTWRSPTGLARVTDLLPTSTEDADLMRVVECLEGRVRVVHDLRLRFDHARSTPWVRAVQSPDGGWELRTLAGPDGLVFRGPTLRPVTPESDPQSTAELSPGGQRSPHLGATLTLGAGQREVWDLAWFPSHGRPPAPLDHEDALRATREFWTSWAQRPTLTDTHPQALRRSLLVLRALTHATTGGIVAAPTASLPELFGGGRNWDYRYTWLRDAALTIEALVAHDFTDGAHHWRDWLLRAIAGDVDDLRIMYGLGGERDLTEKELPHLRGYADSRPVRIGNGAAGQYQADVPGEVMLALERLREAGVEDDQYSWGLQKGILQYCADNLEREDHGIWEMRGDTHHFTHGRVMMWAAFDCGVRAVERHDLDGPVETWRQLRAQLRAQLREEILTRGWDAERGTFTQTYGGTEVDASLLQVPHTTFLPFDDARVLGTVAAIEEDLLDEHGFVHRYRTEAGVDGLEGGEYPFLLCNFWLVVQYALDGRRAQATALMDRLVGLSSDLGLLAEEYDPAGERLAGNFPQAFSHLALVQAADALDGRFGRPLA